METLFNALDGFTETVVDLQTSLTGIPALGPLNGGDGEKAKADFLINHLKAMGITDIREYNAPATDISCGYRPNIVAMIPGKNSDKTLWVISHIDVVPPGDPGLWNSDPYVVVRDGDTLIGRGVEDNQQGLVSSLLTAKALLENDITPELNYGMIFVADEETGSKFGLGYLVKEHKELFRKEDLFLVPDYGEPSAEMVEVAEKSMFWLQVTVEGKQCHASTPDQGTNSLVAAADFILRVKRMESIFDAQDPIYDPPCSTFQPTKKEANVENINTLPGRDIFYIDCRVLPEYNLDDVARAFDEIAREIEDDHGVKIGFSTVQAEQAAPATPLDAEIVGKVMQSVKNIYNNNPRPVGVGGGTVAAYLRRNDFQAVVWSTLNNMAHQPNEWSSIKNTINDAKVIADILTS